MIIPAFGNPTKCSAKESGISIRGHLTIIMILGSPPGILGTLHVLQEYDMFACGLIPLIITISISSIGCRDICHRKPTT